VIEASVWFSGWILASLGLDGLVQTFGQAAALHHAAGELVDQHHFAVLDDVVLVALEQLVARSAWFAWWTREMLAGS
jgi:hypothetical protein